MPKAYSYIRFSTPEQAKGNSLERQIDLSREYANRNNLELDTSLTMTDLGVPSYKGQNVSEGAFGVFLKGVKSGRISSGSVLLVESLDRISRQSAMVHLELFLGITKAGITIITLTDEMVYSRATLEKEPSKLYVSLGVMIRGNEESEIKSKRLSAAWQKKRDSGNLLTARCPSWLTLNREAKRYDLNKERVSLLRKIFRLSASGMGKELIAKTLNKQGVESWNEKKSNGWFGSYIKKILENRSCLGEFQPHKMVDGKRKPVGEPISDYFPAAIKKELFVKAEKCRKKNGKFVGRQGASVGNLFTGIAKSGYSGASMVYSNKGHYKYLVSDNARRGRGEDFAGWRYDHFERSFLTYIKKLDFAKLLDGTQPAEIRELESQRDLLEAEIADNEKKSENLLNEIEAGASAKRVIGKRLDKLAEETEGREKKRDEHIQRIAELESELRVFAEGNKRLETLFAKRTIPEFRVKLRQEIRERVKRIDVYPLGFRWTPKLLAEIEENGMVLDVYNQFDTNQFVVFQKTRRKDTRKKKKLKLRKKQKRYSDYYRREETDDTVQISDLPALFPLEAEEEKPRFFVVHFKGGGLRVVMPDKKDPGKFQQIADYGGDQIEYRIVAPRK